MGLQLPSQPTGRQLSGEEDDDDDEDAGLSCAVEKFKFQVSPPNLTLSALEWQFRIKKLGSKRLQTSPGGQMKASKDLTSSSFLTLSVVSICTKGRGRSQRQ